MNVKHPKWTAPLLPALAALMVLLTLVVHRHNQGVGTPQRPPAVEQAAEPWQQPLPPLKPQQLLVPLPGEAWPEDLPPADLEFAKGDVTDMITRNIILPTMRRHYPFPEVGPLWW